MSLDSEYERVSVSEIELVDPYGFTSTTIEADAPSLSPMALEIADIVVAEVPHLAPLPAGRPSVAWAAGIILVSACFGASVTRVALEAGHAGRDAARPAAAAARPSAPAPPARFVSYADEADVVVILAERLPVEVIEAPRAPTQRVVRREASATAPASQSGAGPTQIEPGAIAAAASSAPAEEKVEGAP